MFKSPFLISILFFCSLNLTAQIFWTGAVDSLWDNPANWNPPVIPDSTSTVNIILDPVNPQQHWPKLQRNVAVDRLVCTRGKLYLNDSTLSCWRFVANLSEIFTGSDTGRLVTKTIGNSIAFFDSKVSGNLGIKISTNQGVQLHRSEFDGIRIISNGVGTQINILDTCRFNRDVKISRLTFPGSPQSGGGIVLESGVIEGDLNCVNRVNGGFRIGKLLPVRPSFGFIVKGKVDIEHSGQLVDSGQNWQAGHFSAWKLRNLTGGGKIIIKDCVGARFGLDTLYIDSFFIKTDKGAVWIDSSAFHSPAITVLSNYVEDNHIYHNDSRLSGNKFYGDLYWTDTLHHINETRGFSKAATIASVLYGSANEYFGDAWFKGVVNLGRFDTSTFHGNLTIEAMDGSVYKRARFSGDRAADINAGSTPFEYAIVDKSSPGTLAVTAPLNISGTMRFDNGKVQTNPGSYLMFLPSARAEGFGAHSYVDGVVQKEGNEAFIFPTGSATAFKPLAMSAPSNATDVVSMQYHASPVHTVSDTSSRVAGLPDISDCEYWEVKQLNGNSAVTLSPSWDEACLDNDIYFTDPQNAMVARWDGSTWQNEGNGGYDNGFIKTANALTPSGLFTFASPKREVIIPPPPDPPVMIVYPNPVSTTLNIRVEPGYNKGMIIDAIGRRISIHTMTAGLNSIDVSQLPSGVYFLKLITARRQFVVKWVKG